MKLKKTILSVVACAIASVMTLAFTACDPTENPTEATVTAIELVSTAEMDTGESKSVISQITYSDGSTKKISDSSITWVSSNESVATVNRGIVTGTAKGTTEITASIGEGDSKISSNKCTVTVHSLTISLDKTEITVDKDRDADGVQLTATVERDGTAVENAEVEWTSSDDTKVTVANGLVKAWAEGTVTVTAKLSGGQSATCTVNATWEKPVGYKEMEFAEQNKLHPGAWGYWYAKESNWGAGLATINPEGTYTDTKFVESATTLKDGYEYIGMGGATFEYEITTYLARHGYQIFFRSSDNFTDDEGVQGKLQYNHVYAVSLKVKANQTGTIHVNPYDDIRAKGVEETAEQYNAYLLERQTAGKIELAKDSEGEYLTDENGIYQTNHYFDIKAGEETEINVIFRHDDCGYIYQTTVYDNMGTALHIELAPLAWDEEKNESLGRTIFSVWDVQFKDLGAADNPVQCDESKHAGWVDPNAPVIPEKSPVMSLADSPKATKASLLAEGEGDAAKAYFVIEGTVDLSKFDNDAEKAQAWLNGAYMDVQIAGGSWKSAQFSRTATVDAEAGTFVIKYDITYLAVSTGDGSGAYGCHFTEKEDSEEGYGDNKYRDLKLDKEHAVPDQTITVGEKKYTIVNYQAGTDFESSAETNWGQAYNYGCVAVKVEAVAAAE